MSKTFQTAVVFLPSFHIHFLYSLVLYKVVGVWNLSQNLQAQGSEQLSMGANPLQDMHTFTPVDSVAALIHLSVFLEETP